MVGIREYLISVIAACMIAVLCLQLVKQQTVKKVLRFVCGLLVLLVAASALVSLDMEYISGLMETMELQVNADKNSLEQDVYQQLSEHIQSTSENYIERKAYEFGATVQARVTLTQEEYPVPYSVTIIGILTPQQKQALSEYLDQSLAIPYERQEWK